MSSAELRDLNQSGLKSVKSFFKNIIDCFDAVTNTQTETAVLFNVTPQNKINITQTQELLTSLCNQVTHQANLKDLVVLHHRDDRELSPTTIWDDLCESPHGFGLQASIRITSKK